MYLQDTPVVYECGVVDEIKCGGDIDTALYVCSSAGSQEEILACVQEILEGSECSECICNHTDLC